MTLVFIWFQTVRILRMATRIGSCLFQMRIVLIPDCYRNWLNKLIFLKEIRDVARWWEACAPLSSIPYFHSTTRKLPVTLLASTVSRTLHHLNWLHISVQLSAFSTSWSRFCCCSCCSIADFSRHRSSFRIAFETTHNSFVPDIFLVPVLLYYTVWDFSSSLHRVGFFSFLYCASSAGSEFEMKTCIVV